VSRVSERVGRLRMPGLPTLGGASLREAERELERAESSSGLLDLTYADTKRWPPPEWVLPRFIEGSRHGMTYTPYRGDPGVRSQLAPTIAALLGVPVDPERDLILTPGSQAALFAVLASVVDPGDRVLLVDPDYLSSERLLRYHGAVVERVPLEWEDGKEPSLDLGALEAGLRKGARLLLFSHPNNPTGAVFTPEHVARIAALLAEHDCLVVVDQLYSRLVFDGLEFAHLATEPGMGERCVTLLGPSKTESMSGYRVGVAIGPPWLVDAMEDVISVSVLRAPAYAQHVLVGWLQADQGFVARRVADYQRLRDRTVQRLRASGVLDARVPLGTAYMFPRVLGTHATEQEVALALKQEAGLVVNPGYQFGACWRGHFRICFAQEEPAWEAALDRMIGSLERLRTRPSQEGDGS
jgi:aspartate/methionine/tyrosine aminotransferase